ncbi:MAG: 3'(2'),5'-bisphosphate nucleotidase CysQ [candidate division Zixibacteria bacterium CG_4_9_14_3_um_filter_46_8]|nr:MAG: 3'(2'),5'-bisphosphate nucleotidase CysQ [candidate division Zixibacteria bacterium CG_4_9_14_3_um_filter_46_8]
MPIAKRLTCAIDLIKKAGEIALGFYGADLEINFKGVNDPVTAADMAVSEFLEQGLTEQFPDDGVLSEESFQQSLVPALRERKFVWIIDPLDGTKEFISRNGEFAIMIGLCENSVPVMGVVNQVARGWLFYGSKNNGAFWEDKGNCRKIELARSFDKDNLTITVSRSHRPKVVDKMISELKIKKQFITGSVGLKISVVATGRADFYYHPSGKAKEWDSCAPQAILEAAGGLMTDIYGETLRYLKDDVFQSKGFLAASPAVHKYILDNVEAQLD